jgi:lysophospholipase L1-like esterase
VKHSVRRAGAALAALALVPALLGPLLLGAAAASAAPRGTVVYDALGDSYASGFGVPPYEACGRSQSAYAVQLDGRMKIDLEDFVACAGATTTSLVAGGQLEALDSDTDLVTIGIGGNDFSIYDSLIRCQDGATCPVEDLRADARTVAGRIEQAVRRITKVAPDAQVYVVGYPDILPTEGTCNAVGVSADVLGPVTEVAGLLNASLREGATAAGASYVDMEAVSNGHDVCAKGRAWVNGPRFRAGIAAPFHPKINGMRAVATEVFGQVTGEDPEVTEYAEPDPDVVVLNQP